MKQALMVGLFAGMMAWMGVGTAVWADTWASEAGLDEAGQLRYRTMVDQLRCVVCQNQTIAESNAPLAQDLREEVASQIRAGRSDSEILDFMTARYGDFVLYKPPFRRDTWLLWLGPFAALLVALAAAVTWLRRRRMAASPETALDDADATRLRELLAKREADR